MSSKYPDYISPVRYPVDTPDAIVDVVLRRYHP